MEVKLLGCVTERIPFFPRHGRIYVLNVIIIGQEIGALSWTQV